MRPTWTGCGTALVTPFTASGEVDEARLRRLTNRQIDAGIHFLVPCGTTGESPTLTPAERRRVVEVVVDEAAGRVPVLAGAGGYDTQKVVEAARDMAAAGAQGLLSVTPYYNRPSPEGLYRHYQAVAGSTGLPVIVYNVPSRTGTNIEPATLARLATIPNVTGVKEASGNMTQICEVCAIVPYDFIVLSGDDAMTLPAMAVGARGVISVASNQAPGAMARLVEAAESGDLERAREIHLQLLSLMLVNFTEPNPIPVKWAMARMGLLDEVYRLPLVPPAPASREKIEAVLKRMGLVDGEGEPA
jgi:4-hydroxy-tetrahydrodipicolinate synthase